MYFLNLDGMVDDLKADRVSQNEYFKYLIGYFALIGFPTEILNSGEVPGKIPEAWQLLLGYSIGIALLFWFLSSVYRANRGEFGKQFFSRYFLLSWVIGLRSMIVTLPLSVLGSLSLKMKLVNMSSSVLGLFLILLGISLVGGAIYYILKMHSAFRQLAENDKLVAPV